MIHKIFSFTLTVVLALTPILVSAQEPLPSDLPPDDLPVLADPVEIEGSANCFDYYTFGSIQADLQPSVLSAASGTKLTFTGQVVNNNTYPVVDGTLYAKVFRQDLASEKNTAGPDVVDQFVIQENINLPADAKQDVKYDWAVPAGLPTGDYSLATFFFTADKFNLLGLSFTDDVIGNPSYFSVIGEQAQAIHFDKTSVTVNDEEYHFAAFPPRVESDQVSISANLANPTTQPLSIPVTWQLYSWDAANSSNLIDTFAATVSLAPGATATTTYTTNNAQHPVYYAVATATYQDTKSIIGVRFVRPTVNRPRLNFPGVTGFPLQAGQETTLFTCLHGMGEADVVSNNELTLALTDSQGQTIHSYHYQGDVSGAMMGLAEAFTPDQTYNRFTLNAELKHDGQIVDQVSLNYNCADLDPSNCPAEVIAAGNNNQNNQSVAGFSNYGNIIRLAVIVLIAIIAIVIATVIIASSRKKKKITPPEPPTV